MTSRPFNPYTNRLMIRNSADFIGRKLEIGKIFSRIDGPRPQSVSVIGQRRIGKSSLLYYLQQPRVRKENLVDSDSYVFVYMDLHGLIGISPDEFLELFIEEVSESAGIQFRAGDSSRFLEVRRLLRQLEREKLKLVLLWDEFESITQNSSFGEAFFSFFRSMANGYNVAYITTSTLELQELCHTEEIAVSPFFNIFTNLYLRVFTPEEARELISGPSSAVGVPLFSEHQPFVLSLAGYSPFFLQIACCGLFDQIALEVATEKAYEEAQKAFAEEAEPHIRYIWEHLETDAKDILRSVAEGGGRQIGNKELLDELEREGYLIARPDSQYRLFSTSFSEIVRKLDQTRGSVQAWSEDSTGITIDPARRFTVLKEIGKGAAGRVLLAEDALLGQRVALKVISTVSGAERRSLFELRRETALARELRHPNICPVFDLVEDQGQYCIAMKYIDGRTLREWLCTDGTLEIGDLLQVTKQVLHGLVEAHQYLVHCDLKPQNIMLDKERHVYILDFGTACWTTEKESSRMRMLAGTPNYMSPEQINRENLDQRSDLYSLGVIMFEMATGRPPFTGQDLEELFTKHLSESPPSPSRLRPDLPRGLEDLILSLLAKEREQRPSSAQSMLAAIDRLEVRSLS